MRRLIVGQSAAAREPPARCTGPARASPPPAGHVRCTIHSRASGIAEAAIITGLLLAIGAAPPTRQRSVTARRTHADSAGHRRCRCAPCARSDAGERQWTFAAPSIQGSLDGVWRLEPPGRDPAPPPALRHLRGRRSRRRGNASCDAVEWLTAPQFGAERLQCNQATTVIRATVASTCLRARRAPSTASASSCACRGADC